MIANLSVLLIDDDKVSHFINGRLLQHIGVTNILTAANGKEALELLKQISIEQRPSPDVIFVDLDMPVLNGFGFIEGFKNLDISDKHSLIIAILTSSSNPRDQARAAELGITQYLTKPISEASLRAILESVDQ